MAYIDGFLIPVPQGNKNAYREMAEKAAPIFRGHGALQIVERWGEDLPCGEHADLFMAVKAREGEDVVFSWVVRPSGEARDKGNLAVQNDPRMAPQGLNNVFDGRRMMFGGFEALLDAAVTGGGRG